MPSAYKDTHMRSLLSAVIFLTLVMPPCYAQQRGLRVTDASSERRVALVIGNSAYETAPLKNTVNDATDMAQALRELGFDVIYRENLNQNDMKRAMREFGSKLRNGGIGLFYYAGHGVAVKGVNYLIPVGAKVDSEEEVEYEAVDAGFVLAQMESAANSLNIVILDACRNNPFARSFRSASRGLAQMDAPSGTLIAYATAPGSVASDGTERNGLYTQELLKNMRTQGVGIEEVLKRVRISVRNMTQGKQTPWESSSLTGDFYFNPANATNNAAAKAVETVPPSAIVASESAAATSTLNGLVIDNSASMNPYLKGIIETGKAIVNRSRPDTETFLVRFTDSEHIQTVNDFTSDRKKLSEGIEALYIGKGQSAVVDAVYLAADKIAQYKNDDSKIVQRSVVLITDGEDRASFYSKDKLFEQLRGLKVKVFIIGLVGGLDNEGGLITKSKRAKATDLLNRIAKESGGRVFYIQSTSELPNATDEITRELQTK